MHKNADFSVFYTIYENCSWYRCICYCNHYYYFRVSLLDLNRVISLKLSQKIFHIILWNYQSRTSLRRNYVTSRLYYRFNTWRTIQYSLILKPHDTSHASHGRWHVSWQIFIVTEISDVATMCHCPDCR